MNLTVVLHQPQDLVNIAGVVRVMKNFALHQLTLVAPAEFESRRITGIAHGSDDLVKRSVIVDDLDTCSQQPATVLQCY